MWENVGCGLSTCGVTEMYQERVCTPAGCSNESRCIEHTGCTVFRDFTMSLDRQKIEMASGEDEAFTLTVSNTGNESIDLNISMESECCVLSLHEKHLTLLEQSSVDIPISIHASLQQQPGTYRVFMNAKWDWLQKNKTVNVEITRNPLFNRVEGLESELEKLRQDIADYRDSGVYVADLEQRASQMEKAISDARAGIKQDDLSMLEAGVAVADGAASQVRGRLSVLSVQKILLDNKWWIALGAIIAFFASYILMEILLPIHKLTEEIGKLKVREKEMVQKRKEIQKQYFMGKISEQAFNDMLIGSQEKVLGVRGMAIEKAKERDAIVRSKLTPRGIYCLLYTSPSPRDLSTSRMPSSA